MDNIHFSISTSRLEDYFITDIFVNGIDLRSIIAKIEQQQLQPIGYAQLSGAYEGISPFLAFHLHDHFNGKTVNEYLYYDFCFTLFNYMYSGVPGDHTLTCKIEITKDKVRWYDFKNFSKIYTGKIDYGELSFSFSAESYRAAIENLKKNEIQNMYV
ncbi:MAG: hypothetical protein AAF573_18840 [Bacteroidota bacterium]